MVPVFLIVIYLVAYIAVMWMLITIASGTANDAARVWVWFPISVMWLVVILMDGTEGKAKDNET